MDNPSKHLTRDQCEALMHGELPSREDAQHLLTHLVRLCPVCLAEWQAYRARVDSSAGEISEELDQAVRQVVGRVSKLRHRIDRERRKAGDLLRELQQLPDLHARVTRVRRSRRFRSWALCELLFDEARALSFSRPDEGAQLAELAIETAWALEDGELGRELTSDLLARGWALLANARRLGGQLELAAETVSMAYFFSEQGSGDPLVRAEVAGIEAPVRRDQLRFAEAIELHDRCIEIYSELDERQLHGCSLLHKAVTLAATGALVEAVEALESSLELLDASRDPRLELCARHTLVLYLDRLGRHDEADRLLAELPPADEALSDPWTRLRHRWLEGQIASRRGQEPQAEQAFRELQWSLVDGGIYHRGVRAPRSYLALLAKVDDGAVADANDNGS